MKQPAPFKAGDPALSKTDIVGSTNETPNGMHGQRGVTRREMRDRFMSGKEYGAMTDKQIASGQRAHARRLSGRRR